MKENLIIIGASGHGKVVADIAIKMNLWKNISFLDDNSLTTSCMGYSVVGSSNDIENFKLDSMFIVAIGNNNIREKVQNKLEAINADIATLIHPSAVIATEVSINKGTVVMAGAIINSSTTIGKGCIINTGSTIDHDNDIGDYAHISPGVNLAGTVRIGRLSWIGIGSTVSNNIIISNNVIIGAGGLVLKDINKSGIYVGSPVLRSSDVENTYTSK